MSKNVRRSLLSPLLLLVLLWGSAPLAVSSPVEVKAILEANMTTYNDYCPTVILFDGKIRGPRPAPSNTSSSAATGSRSSGLRWSSAAP